MASTPSPSGASFTIYHNPKCSTSRYVLDALREAGVELEVVDYLKKPYTKAQLQRLLKAMGVKAPEVLRRKGDLYKELGLDDPSVSEAKLLDAMVQNPVLVERPIVVSPKATLMCRPKERVHELLG
ncbi:arsenate reductase (glutaredoxin) [Hydrogenophaga sp. 5NK40-0174]|uniref:arsenate reductase (glutaredoxin) n=1 Tax=Hydrogenophaga sp. 5NK40-0174 TaxID=3127649 RepID=UPI003104B8E6